MAMMGRSNRQASLSLSYVEWNILNSCALCDGYDNNNYANSLPDRGYLVMTEEGRERLKEGGMEGAYLGDDGRVHIPGKKVTLYSEPSPPRPDKLAAEPVRQLDKQVSSGYFICHAFCCVCSSCGYTETRGRSSVTVRA